MARSTHKKNKAVFTRLVLTHLTALKRFALSLCKNESDADDLVSDTVLKAFEKFHALREPGKVKQWLFRILNNQFISNCRARKKFVAIPREQGSPVRDPEGFSLFESLATSNFVEQGNPEKKFISKLTMADIEYAVKALPDEFRTALMLCDLEEFSYKEIAKTLAIPVGTVRSRIARARIILQRKLWAHALELGIIKGKYEVVKKKYTCPCGKVETMEEMKLIANF